MNAEQCGGVQETRTNKVILQRGELKKLMNVMRIC